MNKISSEMGFSSSTCDNHLCPSKRCPSCGHNLQSNLDWLGFPAGVKFDPSDQELIEHLQAKVEEASKHSKSHPLIDEFITSIEGEDGICYTHPQTLPGVRRDGVSRHFFHRPSKAYTTGTRKRRKIQKECDLHGGSGGETRWHKTGKTRPVMVNGEQRGCKKILVLYTNYGKNRKPGKTNWVMHQYHLGQREQEREGELVVSKIFYQTQPRQSTVPAAAAAGIQNRPLLDGGGGSCSSLETIISHQRDDFSDYIQLKDDDCSLLPFRRTILDEGGNIEETSIAREDRAADGTCQVGDVAHDHLPNQIFHISSISSLMSPFHHNSINYVPRILLPNQDFQEQQHHHKLGASSGLEDLIMSCTSTNTKEGTSIPPNPQEAEWSKYSTFWPEPIGNSDHHGI